MKPYIRIEDQFYKNASHLREVFDLRFQDPLDVHEDRFIWDYWNVPHQYCHLRTPAYHYFPEEIYQEFHEFLVHWGRENLGCHDISPTWLSCYPHGSFQNVHVDEPHGPLAFVYSLTPSSRAFKGGQTIISRDQKVRGLGRKKRELKKPPTEAFENYVSVNPRFNRLTLFDPSFPHGVSEAVGTKDPRFSRLVIHGWFIQPRPFWEGPLSDQEVQEALDELVWKLSQAPSLKSINGYVGIRFQVNRLGQVESLQNLVSTLSGNKKDIRFIHSEIKKINFPATAGSSLVTLPLMFSSGF